MLSVLVRTTSFAAAVVLALSGLASAQGTINLYAGTSTPSERTYDVTAGVPFVVGAYADLPTGGTAAEFVMTEIQELFPGVFKLSTIKINNTNLDLGNNSLGEYMFAFGTCVSPGQHQLVAVQYGDFSGLITNDIVLTIRGFQPGDSRPSNHSGSMGYTDCVEIDYTLTPELPPSFVPLIPRHFAGYIAPDTSSPA